MRAPHVASLFLLPPPPSSSAEAAAALFFFSSLTSSQPLSQPRNSSCVTCGLPGAACAGHFGHIELAVPVYNPLVFG